MLQSCHRCCQTPAAERCTASPPQLAQGASPAPAAVPLPAAPASPAVSGSQHHGPLDDVTAAAVAPLLAGSRSASPEPDWQDEEAVCLAGLALQLAQVGWQGWGRASAVWVVDKKCTAGELAWLLRQTTPLSPPQPVPPRSAVLQGDVNEAMAKLLTWAAAR